VQVPLLKVNSKAVPVHTTKAYILNRGTVLFIQTFAIDGGEWLTSCSSHLFPREREREKKAPI